MRRFREDLAGRDAMLDRHEQSAAEIAELVAGWRCAKCGGAPDAAAAQRVLDLLKGLVREKGDQLQELARRLYSEEAQRELLMVVNIVMQDTEESIMRLRAQVAELGADRTSVTPPSLFAGLDFVVKQMTRVCGVLGGGEFFRADDEALRLELHVKAVSIDHAARDVVDQLESREAQVGKRDADTLRACPLCGGLFPKATIQAHANVCTGAAPSPPRRPQPSPPPAGSSS